MLQIGQTCCYWSKEAKKPLAAICADYDEANRVATLTVFTPSGGRFAKTVSERLLVGDEGYAAVGVVFHE